MAQENLVVEQVMESVSVEPGTTGIAKQSARSQRLRFLIVTIGVMGLIGYLIYSGMRDTMGYYLTVSELLTQANATAPGKIRVGGDVVEGSVQWDPATRNLRFVMTDDTQTTAVVYHGNVPDSFKQGQKVVVEGVYADGVFTANQLMTTCASKYE
jgi:cytochrome c-type biogenesis protein CcmE